MATKKNKPNGKTPAAPRAPKPPSIYGEGYPVDDHGMPIEDAEVPLSVVQSIALDPESARARHEAATALRRKASGDKHVRMPADPRSKFQLAKSLHPSSYVTFKKLEPETDDTIPPRQLSMFQNFDAMSKYLQDRHWDGRQSTYEWTIRDNSYSPWATGLVQFAERVAQQPEEEEDDDMARRGQPQYPPQGYYPNPAYPPQHQYPPPPGYYYPPPPPAPAPAPIPEGFTLSPAQLMQMSMAGQQAGVPPEILGQFLQMFERLSQNNATLTEQLRQRAAPVAPQPMPYPPQPDQSQVFMPYLMQMMELVMKGKDIPPPPPPLPPAPPPPDPLQQMENGLGMLAKFGTLQNKLARQFAPAQPQLHDNPIPDTSPDETPYALHDMGMFRAVMAKPGGPEPSTIEKFALNGDKIGSFVEMVLDKVMTKRDQMQQTQVVDTETVQIKEKAAAIREAAEQTERVLAARRALAQTPAPQQPPPQLNPQFVSVIDVPPPAPPPPEPAVVPPPPPPAAPEIVPLALRMMTRKAAPPVELVPEPGDFDFDPETSVQTAAPEAVADTEPPPPPVVVDAN